jgi:hypothetical protein
MAHPSLPTPGDVLVDEENNATVPFNEWEGWVDGRVVALAIGIGRRAPLPPGAIILARRPTLPYAMWLDWVNRSILGFGAVPLRPPLPPSNFSIVGVDRKATIPFFVWLMYVDRLLS